MRLKQIAFDVDAALDAVGFFTAYVLTLGSDRLDLVVNWSARRCLERAALFV